MMDSPQNTSSESQGSSTIRHRALALDGSAKQSEHPASEKPTGSSVTSLLKPSDTDDRTEPSFRIPPELAQSQSHDAMEGIESKPAPQTPHGDADTLSFQDRQIVQDQSSSINILAAGSNFEKEKTVISQRPVAAPHEFYRSVPLADLAEMLEGRNLDHFLVQQIIGGGGMGAVFRGIDQRLDRVVAIKVIPGSKRDPETLRRFQVEAQAAARLDHPNIARVFYVGESEQWNYIVFEYIEGINIRDLIEVEGPMSVDDAVFFTRQIAEALQHAHERDVVHRDIKPSNILVTPTGMAKLVDMGLARDTSLDKSTGDQTASGVTLGTFDYISPEQARNPRDADVRSDLYSLGCTLFYMLTGNPPFPEGTALQKLLNHGSLPPPDPRGWRDDVSDQLYDIMMKLMAKRPADRYQRPIELVSDLLILAEQENLPRSQGPSTITLNPSISQPTLLETHLPWLVAVIVLLGSTLWLHSQMTLSTGFAFPQINMPAAEPVLNPVGLPSSNIPAAVPATQPTEQNPNKPVGSAINSSNIINSSASGSSVNPPGVNTPSVLNPGTGSPGINNPSVSNPGISNSGLVNPSLPLGPTLGGTSVGGPLASQANGPTNSLQSAAAVLGGAGPGSSGSLAATGLNPTGSSIAAPSKSLSGGPTTPLANDATDTLNGSSNVNASSSNSTIPNNLLSSNSSSGSTGRNTMLEPIVDSAEIGLGASTTPRSTTKLIVSSNQPIDVPVEFWEPSLSRAITRLSNSRSSGEIEIRGTVVLDRPIEIGSIGELTIRGLNSEARIEVSKSLWSALTSETGIISISDGSLNLKAIQLRVSFPDTGLSAWRVFELDGGASLNCSSVEFTLQSDRVHSAFLVAAGDSTAVSARGNDASAIKLTLSNCMVRGNSSLFRVNQTSAASGSSVQVSVSNSVVAVKGRVVDLLGATSELGVERIVRFFSDRSTFVATDGFAQLEYTGGGKPSVGFNRTSQACVFWSAPDIPHIRIMGGSGDPSDNPDQLLLQGTDNAYDQNLEHLVALSRSNTRISELTIYNGQQDGWYVERSTERVVRWKSSPQSINSLMDSRPVDFQLISSHFVPGYRTPSTNTP